MCGDRRRFRKAAQSLRQCVATLNDRNTKPQLPRWQFSLDSLFAATVFVALGLWAWRSSGFVGVAYLVMFVMIVVGNLGIALFGAKFLRPILAGTLGGAVLWSIVAVSLGMLDAGVFQFKDSLSFAFIGALAGLVCGGYARLKCHQVNGDRRKGTIYCLAMFVAFATVFGLGRLLSLQRLLQPDFGSVSHGFDLDDTSDDPYVLEFWGNGIQDDSLTSHFAKIPKDRKLVVYFRHTRVTDTGIRVLADFPNLVIVDLRGTTVSEDGENWLRDRLPRCAIRR